jgi:hypothetical protein
VLNKADEGFKHELDKTLEAYNLNYTVFFCFVMIKQTDHPINKSINQIINELDQTVKIDLTQLCFNLDISNNHIHLIKYLYTMNGKKAYFFIRSLLQKSTDYSIQSLLISAMAQTGYSEALSDFYDFLESEPVISYSAATAIKDLDEFGDFKKYHHIFKQTTISPQVKQIMIMHISELSKNKNIPFEIIEDLEDNLFDDNDNLRYLSLIALTNIGHKKSLSAILKVFYNKNMEQFEKEMDKTLLVLFPTKAELIRELQAFLSIAKRSVRVIHKFSSLDKIPSQRDRVDHIEKIIERLENNDE